MKILISLLFITSTLNSFSQIKNHDIKWQAEVIKVSTDIYDIKFTLIPSKKWWISSPIQDTSKTDLLPTQIMLSSNHYLQTMDRLKEQPIPEETIQKDGEVIKWVKSKTTYTQRIKLMTQHPFISSYSIFFQPRTDEFMLMRKKINGKIIYSKKQLRIKIE
ncbi:MAG: hypothetical protein IPL09_00110 [Bacteroidetes bacterium]|jgi:hypothetical protein|nr:hypothetical protein [Bacteroidota bacterium]MBK7041924.1 hypothetical protein [Bacteroidota bacterium]MBK8327903.1 hypothetical protein [Bacteroidota bacterium]HQW46866.1 hypothetical protein [Chitinophagaceae bacterium]